MYAVRLILESVVFMAALVVMALLLLHLARRVGILQPRQFVSARRVPEGYVPDGGRSLQRMRRRWEIYEAVALPILWLLWWWLQELNRQLPDPRSLLPPQ